MTKLFCANFQKWGIIVNYCGIIENQIGSSKSCNNCFAEYRNLRIVGYVTNRKLMLWRIFLTKVVYLFAVATETRDSPTAIHKMWDHCTSQATCATRNYNSLFIYIFRMVIGYFVRLFITNRSSTSATMHIAGVKQLV